jgi:mRNA interferase MazF
VKNISISRITSNVTRIYSFEVEIPQGKGGLRTRSKVMVNQTRAVDKILLVKSLGHFPEKMMAEVNSALKLHYDLDQ